MLSSRNDITLRGIDYYNATPRGNIDVDIINPDPSSADHLQSSAVIYHLGGDFSLAAHDYGVVVPDD